MVNLGLRGCQKKGRPRLARPLVDRGTPELQNKRQVLLKSLRLNSHPDLMDPSVFDGCYLQQLFYQGSLNQQQLQTGLSVRKLYHHCLRSQGIKNRLSSSSAHWDGLRGNSHDTFEKVYLERKWYAVKKTVEAIDNHLFYNQKIILKITINDSLKPNSCDINVHNYDFLQTLRHSLDVLSYLLMQEGFLSHTDTLNKRSH